MIPVVRVGDMGVGTCCCHILPPCLPMAGIVVSGSGITFADGRPVTRVSDVVVGGCGHIGTVVTGSPVTSSDGIPVARLGDQFVGCFFGTLVTGSPITVSI